MPDSRYVCDWALGFESVARTPLPGPLRHQLPPSGRPHNAAVPTTAVRRHRPTIARVGEWIKEKERQSNRQGCERDGFGRARRGKKSNFAQTLRRGAGTRRYVRASQRFYDFFSFFFPSLSLAASNPFVPSLSTHGHLTHSFVCFLGARARFDRRKLVVLDVRRSWRGIFTHTELANTVLIRTPRPMHHQLLTTGTNWINRNNTTELQVFPFILDKFLLHSSFCYEKICSKICNTCETGLHILCVRTMCCVTADVRRKLISNILRTTMKTTTITKSIRVECRDIC